MNTTAIRLELFFHFNLLFDKDIKNAILDVFFFPRIEKEDSALVQMAPYISRSYREYTLFTIPPPWPPSLT